MTYGTTGGRDGHSAIAALEQARLAAQAGVVASVMVLPSFNAGAPQVKVIGRSEDGTATFYTEVPTADAEAVLEALGELRDVTDVVKVLQADGMDLSDAIDVTLATGR